VRILVTGADGMLARVLVPELRARQHEVMPLDRPTLEVTNREAVLDHIVGATPQVLVQCPAGTSVNNQNGLLHTQDRWHVCSWNTSRVRHTAYFMRPTAAFRQAGLSSHNRSFVNVLC
jgi:dTDP-4-dehydrorhamnose reductase